MKKRTKRIICIVIILALIIELISCSLMNGRDEGTDNSGSNSKSSTEQTSDKDDVSDAENTEDDSTTYTTTSSNKSKTKKTIKSSNGNSSGNKQKDEKKEEAAKEKYTITFIDDEYPDAGDKVTKHIVTLEKGTVLGDDQYPTRNDPNDGSGKVFLGYFFDKESYSYPFLEYLAYDKDITVYARYGRYTKVLDLVDFVYEESVGSDYSVTIQAAEDNSDYGIDDVKNNAGFYEMDGVFDYVNFNLIDITDNGGGSYTLKPKELEPGTTYGFYLSGGYKLVTSNWTKKGVAQSQDLLENYSFISFKIYREEKDFQYRKDIVWLKYYDDSASSEDGTGDIGASKITFKEMTSKDLGTDNNNDDGDKSEYVESFKYSNGAAIKKGQVVCFYKGTRPDKRKYANADSSDLVNQTDVYFCIVTDIKENVVGGGCTYSTRYVDDDELDKIMLLPQVIPLRVGDVPTAQTGTVNVMEYDVDAWTAMGGTDVPEAKVGDFVVFYDNLDDDTTEDELYYGEVRSVNNNKVTYDKVTYSYVLETLQDAADFYVVPDLGDYQLIDEEQAEKLESQINAQLNSDSSEYAKQVKEMLLSSADVAELMDDNDIDKSKVSVEATKVSARVSPLTSYLSGSGAKVSVKVGAVVVIKAHLKDSGTYGLDSDMHYVVSTNFTQEFKVNVSADGKFDIGWHVIIPYIKECWFSISTDIQTATDFTFDIRHYVTTNRTKDGTLLENKDWKRFLEFITCDTFVVNSAAYYKYESEYELYKDSDDPEEQQKATEAKAQMEKVWDNTFLKYLYIYYKIGAADELGEGLENVESYEDFKKLKNLKPTLIWIQSFTKARSRFHEFALNTTIVELLATPEEGLDDSNMKAFVKKYKEMMSTQNTWMTLFKKKLVDEDVSNIPIVPGAVDVVIEPTFYVELNVNIALNANFHFEYGKCYTVKVDIADWDISASSTDTLNQTLELRFIAMGTLGLRCGIRTDIGLKFIKVFTVGFSVDTGPYIEMDGYCFFEYTRSLSNTNAVIETTKKAKGALYIEFGIRLSFDFKLKVIIFGGKSWNIWGHRWKIFGFGDKNNVYKFDYNQLSPTEMDKEENLALVCGDTDYKLPKRWRMMGYMDMTTGSLGTYAASAGHYSYKFYDENPIEEVETESGSKIQYKSGLTESTVMTADSDGKMRRNDSSQDNYEGYTVITWKEPKLAFSNYTIRRAIHFIFSYDQKIEKHPVSVVIKDKDTGEEEEVWVKEIYKGLTYTLPSKEEIMEIIDDEGYKYDADNCNYKDAGSSGVPSYITGRVTGDMKFIFYVKRQSYSIKLKYKYNEVDSKGERVTPVKTGYKTYTALYGDTLDVGDGGLGGTGIKISDTEYQRFSYIRGVEVREGSVEEWSRDWSQPIDGNLAKELLDGKHYLEAMYDDNTVTVTYKFSGIEMEDACKQVECGTIAPELKDIWNTDEAGVKKRLMEAAGIPSGDTSLLTYTIQPARGVVSHNTDYLVDVTVETLQAPYVVGSDRGNVKLASKNKVNEGETLYYGYATKADATNAEILWFKEPFIPNLKKKTDYYFYCRKLFDNTSDRLISPASKVWNWDEEETPTETDWRNGIHLVSSSNNSGAVNVTTQIIFFDSEKTETVASTVNPGEDVYTDAFTDRHDPWMINKIRVTVDGKWSGSVNTYSYNAKYGKELDSNRTESSSANVSLAAGKSKTFTINGPKRRISKVGNFGVTKSSEAGTLADTISLSDETHLSSDGKTWTYKYNGYVADQFSVKLDESGQVVGLEPYNVFEHSDPPYLSVELDGEISSEASPLEFIECTTSEMRIDVEKMTAYLSGTSDTLTVKVKLIFPERSTFIGTVGEDTFTNVFERTITITA